MQAQNTRDSLKAIIASPVETGRVSAMNSLAESYLRDSVSLSLAYARRAFDLATRQNDQRGISASHLNIASALTNLGLHDKAMEHAVEGLRGYSSLKDTASIAQAHSTIGNIYGRLNDYNNCLKHYQLMEHHYTLIHNRRGILIARHNQCTALTNLNQTPRALKIYFENLKTLDTLKDLRIRAATLNNIGNIYRDSSKFEQALPYYFESLKIKKERSDRYGLANTCNNLGETYARMKKFDLAQQYLDEGLDHCLATGAKDRVQENYQLRSLLEKLKGNYAEALDWLTQANDIRDTLYKESIHSTTVSLDDAFEKEKMQAENENLQREKAESAAQDRKQKYFIIALSIGFGLVVALLFVTFFNFRKINSQQAEILRQNAELMRKNEQLEEINLEKDGLISIVAHDLRAPLNRASALASLITATGDVSSEQEKYVNMISRVAEDGNKLIEDLLQLSTYQQSNLKPEIRPLRINEFTEGVLKGYQVQASAKKQSIRFTALPADAEVHTDYQLLGRVIDNLLTNAIKFSPEGKAIQVRIELRQDWAWIHVQDEGPGLSTEEQKKLFRKFQRLSARPTGGESSTGLGLAIVKILVSKLGGQITVDSVKGRGSIFSIGVPVHPVG